MKTNRNKLLIASSILTALGSSLCCILPLVAFILGTSGIVSTSSWISALRPYLALLSVLTLGFAWYRKLRPTKQHCAAHQSPSFWESKTFLRIMTVFSLTMLSFPYYAPLLYPSAPPTETVVEEANKEEVVLKIQKMHCASCEATIRQAVQRLPGIMSTSVSYKTGIIQVRFDKTKTTPQEIERAIRATGYTCSFN